MTTGEQEKLLVVDDDRDLAGMLEKLFTGEGFTVDVAYDGQRGLHLGLSRGYRVMIVDRRLPDLDGLDLLRRLRHRAVMSRVLMLTALGQREELVQGLDSGADDYLAKPFDLAELVARVRALSRRFLDEAKELPLGAACLDVEGHEVVLPDRRRVPLSPREFDLLRALALRPAAVHSRSLLREQLFADTSAESVVDTYVYYLRRKLGRDVVRTIRGFGYQVGTL